MKGANESHVYKYLLLIETVDQVDTASYTCKIGDRETKAQLTITESKLA